MANLSHLLGDVYGDGAEPKRPAADGAAGDGDHSEEHPTAPDQGRSSPNWASEDRLDSAFAEWTAGTMPGDPTTFDFTDEPAEAEAEPGIDAADLDDDVAAEITIETAAPVDPELHAPADHVEERPEALSVPEPVAEAAPELPVEPARPIATRWTPADDDIVPVGGARGRSLRLRRS